MVPNTTKDKRVLLGLSGGVDSTAATLLLQQQGYEVIGLYFDVLGNQEEGKEKAKRVADELNIDFIYKDVSACFSHQVIDYFCQSYLIGETPNPCVKCNPTVKFQTMAEEAKRVGAAYLATGHYARIHYEQATDTYFVRRGINEKKDQSYMLYRLSQDILRKLLLPLGTIEDKTLTRDLVRQQHIGNADTKDSHEICFIQEGNYIDFIQKRMTNTQLDANNTLPHEKQQDKVNRPGYFLDKEGNRLGEHRGIIHYTIGQRKGLGMTFGKPMFVIAMDEEKNTITLGDNEDLFTQRVLSRDNVFFINQGENSLPAQYEKKQVVAKIRYSAKPAIATLHQQESGQVAAVFQEKQRAATPGQSIVFYDGDVVIGGGIICS